MSFYCGGSQVSSFFIDKETCPYKETHRQQWTFINKHLLKLSIEMLKSINRTIVKHTSITIVILNIKRIILVNLQITEIVLLVSKPFWQESPPKLNRTVNKCHANVSSKLGSNVIAVSHQWVWGVVCSRPGMRTAATTNISLGLTGAVYNSLFGCPVMVLCWCSAR